ncbi:(2,3-dihydroxybenzoyl)adenylate synthase [Pseudonocardia cypriaca]|uniref:2,3-dihydroxybenzoate-AMP ligase/mycobactin salicyl-AMP ligase n=1 Tax=Pseudonocardia cypriaca TaxID=882449 RepID=A0A543FSP5_9PSEU|nr:AMP-binding protein [Pseudonocardia cypriaca]TQM36832.1 2,3-dihydroxybenzoate-AMP ligase/mycobactin salicyl-AMP ligase [Pseudonocardia cypriaca]
MIDGVVPFPPEFAARYRARGYWRDRPLRAEFDDVFHTYADRIAVVDGPEQITYRQLDERSTHLARNLVDLGLRAGDRVVVQLPNTAIFVYLYFALQKLGAVPVLALPSHRYREIAHCVSLTDAVACAVPARHRSSRDGDFSFPDMVRRIGKDQERQLLGLVQGSDDPLDDRFVALEELLLRKPDAPEEALASVEIDPDDPAVFLLSGGTTGVPKLIPRSHNDYVFNSRLAVSVCDVSPDDALLLALPIEHNLPLACPGLQGFLLRGARVVLSTSTRPADVFDLVERHRVTHIHLVPSLLIRWLADPGIGSHDLSSLRVLQSGGQRLQPEVRERAGRLIPTAVVQENFGMAEGLLMFVRLDDPDDVRRETCGRPICPDDEVRLVDDDGRDVPPGEVGELCVRGPYTLRGYFRAPEHNTKAFTPDGYYLTGDLMRLHPSGNYVVEGRKKDLINRGGEKISAEEVENLILAHPDVANVACVPVPDEVLGERMCACVVLRPGTELELGELCDFLLAFEIAKHKLPERLEFFDELPLSPIGKVSKKDLVASVTEG